MKIMNITIARRPTYASKDEPEFTGNITLAGNSSYQPDIKLNIEEEMLDPIVSIISQATVHAMKGAAEAFAEEVQLSLTPPIETESAKLEDLGSDKTA